MLRTSRFIALLAALAAGTSLNAGAAPASLEGLKILVPAAPGGGWDQTGRALQAALQKDGIVRRITVDNRPGAGGTIGLAQFVGAHQNDGRALLVGGAIMMGAIVTNRSPVNLSQVTPLARLTGEYEVVVVPANSKFKSLADLLAELKRDPAAVSWAGGSIGSTDQVLAAMLGKHAGVPAGRLNYIAYAGGGEAQAAIIGGHVSAGISGYAEFAPQIQAGRMRALAISSPQRLDGVDIPTFREQGVDVEIANWRGVFAAPGVDAAERAALAAAIERAVRSASWQQTLQDKEWTNLYLPGPAFAEFLKGEQQRMSVVMGELGLGKP